MERNARANAAFFALFMILFSLWCPCKIEPGTGACPGSGSNKNLAQDFQLSMRALSPAESLLQRSVLRSSRNYGQVCVALLSAGRIIAQHELHVNARGMNITKMDPAGWQRGAGGFDPVGFLRYNQHGLVPACQAG